MAQRWPWDSQTGVKKNSLEIKCPHSYRNSNIQALTDNDLYTHRDSNSKVLVKEDPEYYYQIQQNTLLVSKLEKCHFLYEI